MPSKRKKKPRSISSLKKELDRVFSLWIRQRDTKCYTCGALGTQNGHFAPRQILSLRWDERNCHSQCSRCNLWLGGNPSVYAVRLVEQYGEGILREIELKRQQLTHLDRAWYEKQIAIYKQKLFELSPQIPSVWINNLADDEITL